MEPSRSLIGRVALLVVGLGTAHGMTAQQTAALPPIRQLGSRLAISIDTIGNVFGIRQLSDGRVIVNDNGKRRLLLLDATLSHAIVIADSTSNTKKAYGAAPGGILSYRNDTTLFVDPVALSMLVIDPNGVIVRTVAPPRPGDAASLTMPAIGNGATDAAGRIVYRDMHASCSPSGVCHSYVMVNTPDTSASTLPTYALHDSAVLLRGDIATRQIDTAGFVAIPYVRGPHVVTNPDGSFTNAMTVPNPIPIADDWAVTADGSVAFVRGLDYHIDWINADGTRTSTPRIAHDWHRLSDSEKTVILDSARRYIDSLSKVTADQQARTDSISKAMGRPLAPRRTEVHVWPSATDLPDYRPIISRNFGGGVKADADDNLWILQGGSSRLVQGSGAPAVYDLVNRQGRLIDRVQLPPTLSLAGFAREAWMNRPGLRRSSFR